MDPTTKPVPDEAAKDTTAVVEAPADATPGVPEGAHFTEVPPETQPTEPIGEPGKVIGAPVPPADKAPVKEASPAKPARSPKSKETGTKKPVVAVSLAVIIFIALAAAAYYAYTKTK